MKTLLSLMLSLPLIVTPALAQTLNDTFEGTTPLTDQEQAQANKYYHQGRANTVLEAECAKLGESGCFDQTDKPGSVLGGFDAALPRLYAIMGTLGAAGIGNKIAMRPTPAVEPATTPTEREPKNDLCMYIPIAGEAVAMATQSATQNQIQSTASSAAEAQRESLYAVARTHESRAKTATMQATIYAGTGACYVAYLATGADPKSYMLWVKMGAATAMSAIFFKKAAKHKDYAKQVKAVAKKLPGSGACNPMSQTHCFCSEETSRATDIGNWNRYCLPKGLTPTVGTGTPAACSTINSAGQAVVDAACQCRTNNSCASAQIAGLTGQIGLGSIALNDPLRTLDLVSGSADDASMANFANGLNARTNRALAGSSVASIPSVALSEKDKSTADKLREVGLPSAVANHIAGSSGDGVAPSASAPAMATTPEAGAAGSAGAVQPGYNSAGGSRGSSANSGGDAPNPFAQFGQKAAAKPAAVQVETFAQQAVRDAEITKDTSRGIFDIISNRYRASGWKQLESSPTTLNPSP